MTDSFLKDVAIVLGVAAVTSAITHRFKLPTILGYMAAGLLTGPYIPLPLFADHERVETLSEFGVILVMFSVGLEFRLKRFFQVLPTAGVTTLLEMSTMALAGLSLGYLFGWSTTESIFLGAALCISSTLIVSKTFEEKPPDRRVREHVFSILIVQDIFAILILTILGTFAASRRLQVDTLVPELTKLVSVLVVSTALGLMIVPRFVRYVSKLKNNEILLIVSMGICFATATLVETMGYSIALGAFLAGILVAESGSGPKIEHLSKPVKDIFAAIFFVSVGMYVDPLVALEYLPQSLLITLMVISLQFLIIFIGGTLSGVGLRKSLYSSLALGQIGEFAFIIAAIGVSSQLVEPRFQAIIVSVAIMTSLSTPILWRRSEEISSWIIGVMPSRFKIAISLYEAWFTRLRTDFSAHRLLGIPRTALLYLIADSLLLVALPPALLTYLPRLVRQIPLSHNIDHLSNFLVFFIFATIMLPILLGLLKNIGIITSRLSETIFSNIGPGTTASEPIKKLFSITTQVVILLLVGIPTLSTVRPFINTRLFYGILILFLSAILMRVWKRAGAVESDFETGSEQIINLLSKQTFDDHQDPTHDLKTIGFSDLKRIRVINSKVLNKSLGELNLRRAIGGTIVSIERDHRQILFPDQAEVLQDGDVVYIWGEEEVKSLFKRVLSIDGYDID